MIPKMIPKMAFALSSKVLHSTSLILDNASPNNGEERREELPNDGKGSMRQIRGNKESKGRNGLVHFG